ncbi:MAG: hypothetical protein ACRD10_05935, partial [Terriglobia bacterium]
MPKSRAWCSLAVDFFAISDTKDQRVVIRLINSLAGSKAQDRATASERGGSPLSPDHSRKVFAR